MKNLQPVAYTSVVPSDGWQGILNIFRNWLGRPIVTNVVHGIYFPTPVVLQPGESLTVVFTPQGVSAQQQNAVDGASPAQ